MSMNLLSNAGTQSLANYFNYGYVDKYTGQFNSNYSTLASYSSYTASSIFDNFSGIQCASYGSASSSTSPYHCVEKYGDTGLNLNGPVPYNGSTSRSFEVDYSGNGSSIIGNFMTSLQNVALGEYAPTSIAEQRINYHLPISMQHKPGTTINPTMKYLGLTSSRYAANSLNDTKFNNAIASSYNVFNVNSPTTSFDTNFSQINATLNKIAPTKTSNLMELMA